MSLKNKKIILELYQLKELLVKFISRPLERKHSRFLIAEKISSWLYPEYIFSEFGRIWLEDKKFFEYYRRYEPQNSHSADRKFFLRSLLGAIENLPGETAECGVYRGASSELICEAVKLKDKRHHGFDSFEGLSEPIEYDENQWRKGDLKTDLEEAQRNLAAYNFVTLYKGWIPERFPEVADKKFCFVHIDVDIYEPTLASLNFFYPRLVPRGIMLCDDYGFSTCPGARKAIDEFFANKTEKIIQVPTGQAFIIKHL